MLRHAIASGRIIKNIADKHKNEMPHRLFPLIF